MKGTQTIGVALVLAGIVLIYSGWTAKPILAILGIAKQNAADLPNAGIPTVTPTAGSASTLDNFPNDITQRPNASGSVSTLDNLG